MTEEHSKDSIQYRIGAHEASECPKIQDGITVPPNSGETTSRGALSNGDNINLSGDLYEENVHADYAALAALDVNKWVDSYGQIYNEENDGCCYSNDIKTQDCLRRSPMRREFLQSTQVSTR